MYEFKGKTLGETISKAFQNQPPRRLAAAPALSTKAGSFTINAPPKFWGPWAEIWAQAYVQPPNPDQHVASFVVTFDTVSGSSTFDVEIKGGDEFIRTVGPGEARVTVTGNVITSVSIRCKSHSLGQVVLVTL